MENVDLNNLPDEPPVKYEQEAWENMGVIYMKAKECLNNPNPMSFKHFYGQKHGEDVYVKTR